MTAMMAAQGRASWTEYGWWCLTAAVEDKGGGCSMAAGAFNGGNDGQLGQRGRCRRNNQMKEEAAFGCFPMLSDSQSVGGGASVGCQ